MQLSLLRFGKAPVWAKVKRIPGLLYAGKYQLYKPVTQRMKKNAVESIMREERNLELLSRPYLTKEQEKVAKAMVGKRESMKEAKSLLQEQKRIGDHLIAKDFLSHLNSNKAWE